MKVSKGEPESPLQEASIGVPQTPSNSELVLQLAYSSRWPEGQDTVADTVHGCPCAAIICVQLLPRCTPRGLGIGVERSTSSLVHSVSDVVALFQAAVSHGLGTAVRVFRRRPTKTPLLKLYKFTNLEDSYRVYKLRTTRL